MTRKESSRERTLCWQHLWIFYKNESKHKILFFISVLYNYKHAVFHLGYVIINWLCFDVLLINLKILFIFIKKNTVYIKKEYCVYKVSHKSKCVLFISGGLHIYKALFTCIYSNRSGIYILKWFIIALYRTVYPVWKWFFYDILIFSPP